MSKLLIVLGIILIVVGGAGMALGFGGITTQFTDVINQATSADAEDLCRPGEELEEESGAESYSPGVGYGRTVRYFCVDDSGERREVTGDFVQGMLGDVGAAIMPMLSGSLITIISPLILTFGFILAILGFVFSRRRPRTVTQYVYTTGQGIPQTFNTPSRQPPSTTFSFPTQPQARGDLTAKLRQLDEARQANLISEDEYQRMRQEILDSMG
jgi:hypothetical protein